VRAHLVDEVAADLGVGEREPFGELDRKAFSAAETVDLGVPVDDRVFLFGDRRLRTRRRTRVQSNGAGVDLSDPHACELALTRRQFTCVHRPREVACRLVQIGRELPHPGLLGVGALGQFDSCHQMSSVFVAFGELLVQ
jgi:hypothetical protein